MVAFVLLFSTDQPRSLSALEQTLRELLRAPEWPIDLPGYEVFADYAHGGQAAGGLRPSIRDLAKRPLSGALADLVDEVERETPDLNDAERRLILELRVRLRRRAEFQETQSARFLVGDEQVLNPSDDVYGVEYAFVHRIHATTATIRLAETRATSRLPELMALLERGEIDLMHVRVAAWESIPLTDEACAEFDRRLAGKADKLSVSELRAEARKVAMAVDPDHARRKADGTRKSADVRVFPHSDGDGADLVATGPAADIAQMMAAINTRAGLDEKDDSMSAGCRRFHALKSLINGGLDQVLACNHCGQVVDELERGSKRRRARNRVVVTIPDRTLRGESVSPGTIEGVGPIEASEARRFAAQPGTTFHRLFYDPVTGVATNFDPKRYRLTPSESELLAYRDGVCMAPGCHIPASHCEADHTFEAGAGGPTDLSNLQSLCDQSHDAKTQHGLHAEQNADGTGQTWVTPLGGRFEKDYRDLRAGEPAATPDDEPPF